LGERHRAVAPEDKPVSYFNEPRWGLMLNTRHARIAARRESLGRDNPSDLISDPVRFSASY